MNSNERETEYRFHPEPLFQHDWNVIAGPGAYHATCSCGWSRWLNHWKKADKAVQAHLEKSR